MSVESIASRLTFLMRRMHGVLFGRDLRVQRSVEDMLHIFADIGIDIYQMDSNIDLPLACRIQHPQSIRAASLEQILTDLELRFLKPQNRHSRLMVMVPKSQRHHSRHFALYVIETLLFDVLQALASKGWKVADIERYATQLAQYALYGSADELAHQLRTCRPHSKNLLESIGQLHEDAEYDIPIATTLSFLADHNLAVHCAHVHYAVDEINNPGTITVIQQHSCGGYPTVPPQLQKIAAQYLSHPNAAQKSNSWHQSGGMMAYSYSLGRTGEADLARRMHPVATSAEVDGSPLYRVAVIAKLR